jgi:hypothetical protein
MRTGSHELREGFCFDCTSVGRQQRRKWLVAETGDYVKQNIGGECVP